MKKMFGTAARLICVVIAAVACQGCEPPRLQEFYFNSGQPPEELVPMAALLAVPETYDGRIVQTVGYLGFDPMAIYLSSGDAQHRIVGNALYVFFDSARQPAKTLDGSPVIVQGKFRRGVDNPIPIRHGIDDVSRFDSWGVSH